MTYGTFGDIEESAAMNSFQDEAIRRIKVATNPFPVKGGINVVRVDNTSIKYCLMSITIPDHVMMIYLYPDPQADIEVDGCVGFTFEKYDADSTNELLDMILNKLVEVLKGLSMPVSVQQPHYLEKEKWFFNSNKYLRIGFGKERGCYMFRFAGKFMGESIKFYIGPRI